MGVGTLERGPEGEYTRSELIGDEGRFAEGGGDTQPPGAGEPQKGNFSVLESPEAWGGTALQAAGASPREAGCPGW